MSPRVPQDRSDFEIAVVCALPEEADAVLEVFDEHLADYGTASDDDNSYSFGRLGEHNVILVHMPGMGNVSSSAIPGGIRKSFPNVGLALLVGICGGVPQGPQRPDIFLGDLVISTAVIQHDFGKHQPTLFERKDTLEDVHGRPNPKIRGVLKKLSTRYYIRKLQAEIIESLQAVSRETPQARCPGPDKDQLYHAEYIHQHRSECTICAGQEICNVAQHSACEKIGCDAGKIIRQRSSLLESAGQTDLSDVAPTIHLGRIGSGNAVIRSGKIRDLVAHKEEIIAFEMEGAGLWDQIPCIIIKAVSDYSDSHKNKDWRFYAAAVAAAGAKALLRQWPRTDRAIDPEVNFTPTTSRSTTLDELDSARTSVIFNNHGSVGSQVQTQHISGDVYHNFRF